MSHTTTKWGLIVPDETDADDVPSWLDQLASGLDETITGWFPPNTWANRPAGAQLVDGLLFWATDQGQFYVVQGGALHQINPIFGIASDISASAFGDTAAAGATGKAADAAHRHAREANPLTTHLLASDPHPQYDLDAEVLADIVTAQMNSESRYTRTFMMMGA